MANGADITVTILGCGTSRGVPSIPEDWGDCDPSEPKNRRQRASVMIQSPTTTLVIDTTPDFRNQMISAGVTGLDAVLLTHDHADHTHGIDDVRGYSYAKKAQIPVYMNAVTQDVMLSRFGYVFEGKGGYPAICSPQLITAYTPFTFGDIEITPFNQTHGRIMSLGFRVGNFAYSTDLNALEDAAFAALDGVDVWVVDALRYDTHPTHSHLGQTLDWIEKVAPKQAFLTHMTGDMDYQTLEKALPQGVAPAYDGLKITL